MNEPVQPPDQQPGPKVSTGAVFGGCLLVPMFSILAGMIAASIGNVSLLGYALLVGIPALVGGGVLLFLPRRSPVARGFGIGMLIGWAALSIFTGGICTGLTEFTIG